MKIEGRTAVITGASTGMGRALAIKLVQQGCHVAMCDINIESLEKTYASALKLRKNESINVSMHKADVSDSTAMKRFAAEVIEAHKGKVHILFANAGVSGIGELIHDESKFTEEDVQRREKSWDRCFNIDYFGVLYSIRAFLPTIVKQDEGYVVITSSVNGFWTWPCHGSYTAAKFAVRGLAESLLCETYIKAPHVHIACVHPGKVNTDIVRNSMVSMQDTVKFSEDVINKADNIWKADHTGLSSDEAVDWILHGVKNNRTRIMVGYDAYCLDFIVRVFGHRAYDLFWRIGQEGISEFGPGDNMEDKMAAQFRKLSLLSWIKIAISARYFVAFFLFPLFVIRYPKTRTALGLYSLYKLHGFRPNLAKLILAVTSLRLLKPAAL